MCATCGCSDAIHVGHSHAGDDAHEHEHHANDEAHDPPRHALELAILAKNDKIAERTRRYFRQNRIAAVNLVSSPGAGKTTLLERTIADLRGKHEFLVIEGDQATTRDADRIRRAGAAAIQINTGTGCHLDAAMVERRLRTFDVKPGSVLFIENVGNLVCPALFDLGEHAKVLVASTADGDDKPLKYPHMFRASRLVLLNKSDLLSHVPFDVDRFVHYARQVNPRLDIMPISALDGTGVDRWYSWVRDLHAGA
jgi:hydrogenase nickel incorporation protein HypB